MNYDHFERQVLGYDDEMRRRAERRRMLRGGLVAGPAGVARAEHRARVHVAAALRSLANHVEARPASF